MLHPAVEGISSGWQPERDTFPRPGSGRPYDDVMGSRYKLSSVVQAGLDVLWIELVHRPESGAMTYVPNHLFSVLEQNIEDYDILVIPGAHFDVFDKLLPSNEGKELTELLRKFTSLAPREEAGTRILQSVCTGSIILAASGVLQGRTITTHHMGFEFLKQWADKAAGGDSNVEVVRKRWVDAGTTDAGVRIINAAGVSSGIDTSLWIYEQLAGKEQADFVAEVAEFERRSEAWGV